MIRVLIVDDSAFNRMSLERMLSAAPDIEVCGAAANGHEAMVMIRSLQPDIITLDLEMPEMDGLSLLRWLKSQDPVAVLVVTSRESNASLFEALQRGALDFVIKPGRMSPDLEPLGQELIDKIRQVAELPAPQRQVLAPVASVASPRVAPSPTLGATSKVIVLAASTGGPPALQSIITRLPRDFPAAVLVVQHMPPFFTGAFARRLDELSMLDVSEARHGDKIRPGQVLVAPGGCLMSVSGTLRSAATVISSGATGERHLPSADALMHGVARIFGARCAGVVLTGMGNDGTRGLAAIREAGGWTMAEAEETAVVYGMPRQAVAAGVVDTILPLHLMVEHLEARCMDHEQAVWPGQATAAVSQRLATSGGER